MRNTLLEKLKKKNYFLIAEIGNNHGGSFSKAKKLILSAKKAGADAVKFQFTNPKGLISHNEKKRFEQLKKISLSFNQFKLLKSFSNQNKIEFFVSIFDIDFINKFKKIQNIFKIASGDNNYLELIKKITKLKKSIIISTGLTDKKNFLLIKKFLNKNCSKRFIENDLCVMHCVSSYPCKEDDLNLSFIEKLKKEVFISGYSDHSKGIEACIYSYLMGARVIEKHFTLAEDKKKSFRDHQLSASPKEFFTLKKRLDRIVLMRGNGVKKIEKGEKTELIKSRRSLCAKKLLKKGEILTKDKIIFLRPGGGIPPSYSNFLGKKIKVKIYKNQMILNEDLAK